MYYRVLWYPQVHSMYGRKGGGSHKFVVTFIISLHQKVIVFSNVGMKLSVIKFSYIPFGVDCHILFGVGCHMGPYQTVALNSVHTSSA